MSHRLAGTDAGVARHYNPGRQVNEESDSGAGRDTESANSHQDHVTEYSRDGVVSR
jgi:hypothetical protein